MSFTPLKYFLFRNPNLSHSIPLLSFHSLYFSILRTLHHFFPFFFFYFRKLVNFFSEFLGLFYFFFLPVLPIVWLVQYCQRRQKRAADRKMKKQLALLEAMRSEQRNEIPLVEMEEQEFGKRMKKIQRRQTQSAFAFLFICLLCVNSRKSLSFAKRLRQKWEWERERGGEGGGGGEVAGVTRNELENELAGRSTLNQRHKCADLPPSWRLTSTRTHSLPRTLAFRGFTSHQLGSSSLTLGPPVDTAFMTSHGHQRTVTSGR